MGQKSKFCLAIVAFGVVIAAAQPASAGFFDRLFGDIRRAVEPSRAPEPLPYANPMAPGGEEQLRADTSSGPAKAFCVRTCDGHFFPVNSNAGQTAAESCKSFCPASETKIFGGSNIDTATAPDGRRYGDLPNAFLYRKAIVNGCTCNGKTNFGLARMDATNDPTLRQGDIVATKTGLAAYTGTTNNTANFTPVENYSRLSKTTREKLAETKIMGQSSGQAPAEITPVVDSPRDTMRGTVQFQR
jgi:hypothetical protein